MYISFPESYRINYWHVIMSTNDIFTNLSKSSGWTTTPIDLKKGHSTLWKQKHYNFIQNHSRFNPILLIATILLSNW